MPSRTELKQEIEILRASLKDLTCSSYSPARLIDDKEAKTVGDSLNINWDKINLKQFTLGLNVEMEHGCRDPQTNVTSDDILKTGRIALAHLKEIPDYYTRLEVMERGRHA